MIEKETACVIQIINHKKLVEVNSLSVMKIIKRAFCSIMKKNRLKVT